MVFLAQRKEYDAIVVGSGISGGYAAKELTEKGLETLVLEAGRPTSPEQDYVEHVQPWPRKGSARASWKAWSPPRPPTTPRPAPP